MNVKELRERLEELERDGHAEDGVTVDILGDFLRGCNAKVTGVFPGFDWESGQAVIRTDPQLGVYQKPSERPGAPKARPKGEKETKMGCYEYEELRKEPLPDYVKGISPVILDSLDRYAMSGCPVGNFLRAVLEHDLFKAFQHADDDNSSQMRNLVTFVYNRLPATCHGSPEAVDAWIKNGGIKGR